MIASLRRTAFTFCLTMALCAAAATAPVAAQADSGTCDNGPSSQPFANWGDNSSYVLAPGGDFEGSAPWTLNGNAAVVAGSESFAATGTLGSYSLSLPQGSSAESSAACIDANDPTLRFFVGGSGRLLVQVVYSGVGIPVGVVNAGGDWAPSAILPTGSALFERLWGGSDQVYLKFTALTGNPQVDDVFIDPWNRH
jgi:hypothetical protein